MNIVSSEYFSDIFPNDMFKAIEARICELTGLKCQYIALENAEINRTEENRISQVAICPSFRMRELEHIRETGNGFEYRSVSYVPAHVSAIPVDYPIDYPNRIEVPFREYFIRSISTSLANTLMKNMAVKIGHS